MKSYQFSIVLMLIINISLLIYYSILDGKIQSYTDEFEEHTTMIINRNTDIEDFQCLYNKPYFPGMIEEFYINHIRDYKILKGQYKDYVNGINNGHIINVGIPTLSCLHTSQRIFNYNIDNRIRNEFLRLKRMMMIGPQGMYLHRQTIQFINDDSNGFCKAALINTDRVDYSFELEINGQAKDFHYAENITLDNDDIENDIISITVFDPCEKERRREFRLRI